VLSRRTTNPELYDDQKAVDDHIALMQPGGKIIEEPNDLAIVEQLRTEAASAANLGMGYPTDVFVFIKGESRRRDVTKVGGLPYWPADRQWPRGSNGMPLGFLAQLNFSDSRDIVPQLPEDLLLIFADLERINRYEIEDDILDFYWMPIQNCELISVSDIPKCVGINILGEPDEFSVTPYRAELHRTCDYPYGEVALNRYQAHWRLGFVEGTKFGGIPMWIQGEASLPGEYVATLGGCYEFAWGDAGMIYLYVADDGQPHWAHQCY
jgi:hypothetical protein